VEADEIAPIQGAGRVIRIAITAAAAFEAVSVTLPGSVGFEGS
jgi:hypothetical protein